VISNPLFRAVAEGVGLDPDGPTTDGDMESLIAGQAIVRVTLDGNDQLVATVIDEARLEPSCSA
jgi:hypothetical protein